MKNLVVKGKQEFLGKEIPVVEGGFGNNHKVVLAKTIAEIHGVELKEINKLINNNIDEFEEEIDILDLKSNGDYQEPLIKLGFSNRDVMISKNIYILSEQGYMALVGLMRTDKARELRKKFRREYFTMREVINSNEQLKANLLLQMYVGGADAIAAAKKLSEIEVEEATVPLLETISEKETIIDRVIKDDGLYGVDFVGRILKPYSSKFGARNIFKYLREKEILMDAEGSQKHNMPYSKYSQYFEIKQIEKEHQFGYNVYAKPYFTGKGFKWLLGRLVKDNTITNTQKDDVLNKL